MYYCVMTANIIDIWLYYCVSLQYKATEMLVPGAGKVQLTFIPNNKGGGEEVKVVHEFEGPGVALAMFNTDESIR
jgi:isocitrate dehydrogenase